MQTPTREERIVEYCRSTREEEQMRDAENCDTRWLLCTALEDTRNSYVPRADDCETRIGYWHACADVYPWGRRFVKANAVEHYYSNTATSSRLLFSGSARSPCRRY